MFRRIGQGFKVGINGIRFIFKQPKTLIFVPVFLLCFSVCTGLIVLLYILIENVSLDALELSAILLMIFILSIMFVFSSSVASLVLLELIEQHETEGSMSVKKAFHDMWKHDLKKALFVMIVWSIMALIVRGIQIVIGIFTFLIEGLFVSVFGMRARFRLGVSDKAASVLLHGIRVYNGFVLGAIAWEDLPPRKAMKRGWEVLRGGWLEMIGAIVFTNIITFILLVPAVILFNSFANDGISETTVTIVFGLIIVFGGILTAMIQQIYTAEVYLWYLSWEKDVEDLVKVGGDTTQLREHPRPSLLNNITDLERIKE